MVRLIDISTTITATLLSTLALASPLPQQDGVLANQSISESSTQSTVDVETNVVFTTYTTILYTTNTFTTTRAPAPTILLSTTPNSLTNPDEPRLTTGTDTITKSFAPDLSRSGTSFHTVPSSFQNASTTLFANTTTLPQTTTPFNATTLLNATTSTTILSTTTSSTLATIVSLTSVTVSTTSAATTAAVSSALAITTCRPAAIPEAPTNDGTVEDCTLWYVAQAGDYCFTVAQNFGISVDTFMDWNPSVGAPACTRMMAGDAYCVQVCGASSSAVLSATSTTASSVSSSVASSTSALVTLSSSSMAGASSPSYAAASPTSTLAPADVYRAYNGDGTAADGWPTESQWVSFDYMFIANSPSMRTSCDAWGVPNNSNSEMAILREQILAIGQETNVDPRFILAIIMQESTGCVRVITTAYAHDNPGLMQSFNGTGSCNSNSANINIPGVSASGTVLTPCPESEIRQQILDGTNGTVWGPGLLQDLAEQGNTDSSRWYRAARLYNGGAIVEGDLSLPCCTASYASDIANRMTGWVHAPRVFTPE